LFIGIFWSLFLPDADDSTTNASIVQAWFSPRHIFQTAAADGWREGCLQIGACRIHS
jgi:hypothetical protein